MSTTYSCKTCGEEHAGPPLVYGPDAPAPYAALSDQERKTRAELSSDQCVIQSEEGEDLYFLRGRLEIPIQGSDDVFAWLVWVSLSEKSFLRASELWNQEGRESEPPMFGWLCTLLPCYEVETTSLKTHVHTRPVGQRPFIEVEPTQHPLAIEQREGISRERLIEIAEGLLHS
jgi:hypothetical protein